MYTLTFTTDALTEIELAHIFDPDDIIYTEIGEENEKSLPEM